LYLARACLAEERAALDALQREVLVPVSRAVRRVDASDAFVDEVLQLTRMKLLVGTARQARAWASTRAGARCGAGRRPWPWAWPSRSSARRSPPCRWTTRRSWRSCAPRTRSWR
ncbi:hypothetical protein ACLESO_58270, partial [Pyxidicoccus sp. 3LG]